MFDRYNQNGTSSYVEDSLERENVSVTSLQVTSCKLQVVSYKICTFERLQ